MPTHLTRRELLARSVGVGATALLSPATRLTAATQTAETSGVWVNDIHSQLNRTQVAWIDRPRSLGHLVDTVRRAAREQKAVSVAGGRHAMGGQQFATDSVLIDTAGLHGVTELDTDGGYVEVGSGTQWPELVRELAGRQSRIDAWGIVQKQTGADRLSIGGALSANIHSRGLTYQPVVQDVDAFTLVDAQGRVHRCSRRENSELFRLAIGGYGLFGIIASVRLKLARRRRIERVAEIVEATDLARRFDERIADGYLFGDFQYSTDVDSDTLLRRGVFACYRPTSQDPTDTGTQRELGDSEWLDLLTLAHTDRGRAFERYAAYYVGTSGQTYWSDTHQMSTYLDDYHRALGPRIGSLADGSEMITEIYVPREALSSFLDDVRVDFIEHDVNLIYGTVRVIDTDADTFMPWARRPWACVIFNLHTNHDADALSKTATDFRRLIDRGRAYDGSYFLTYHRWASPEQVLACHPQFPEFLRLKRAYDPDERLQSDWYRHHRDMFA